MPLLLLPQEDLLRDFFFGVFLSSERKVGGRVATRVSVFGIRLRAWR